MCLSLCLMCLCYLCNRPVQCLFCLSPHDIMERLKTPTLWCWQSIFCSSLCAQSTKVTCSNIPSWGKFLSRSRKYKRVRKNCLQLKSFRWDQSKQSHCNNMVTNMNCKASIKSCRVLLFFPGLCSQHVHNFSNFPFFFSSPRFPIHSIFYTSNIFHNCHLASQSVWLALPGPALFTKCYTILL